MSTRSRMTGLSTAAPEPTRAEPTNERIAARAYELFLERGRDDGHDVDDWLRAERELHEERAPEYEKV